MPSIVVMMIYYTAGTVFSPTITPAIISSFQSLASCEAARPQAMSDFTRHPYRPKGQVEVPIVECYSYPP